MPWSTPGLTAGLAAMAKAISGINLHGGHTAWSSGGIPKLIPNSSSIGGQNKRPFDIVIDYTDLAFDKTCTATFSNCIFWRGGITEYIGTDGDLALAIPAWTASPLYVSHNYDDDTNTHTMISGATLASVTHSTTITDSETEAKYLKWILETNAEGFWTIRLDARSGTSGLYG